LAENAATTIWCGDKFELGTEASTMPPRQTRLIQAWIEIHREELMADWMLAIRGETLVKIDPLH